MVARRKSYSNAGSFLRGMAARLEGSKLKKTHNIDYQYGWGAADQFLKEHSGYNSLGEWLDQFLMEMVFKCSDCGKIIDGSSQGGSDDERCDECWVKVHPKETR